MARPRPIAAVPGLIVAAATALLHAEPPPSARFVTHEEVRAVIEARASRFPPSLSAGDLASRQRAFDAWVRAEHAAVRARVRLGEEDSLAALLLFGTSFTAAPRLTRHYLDQAARGATSPEAAASAVEAALTKAFRQRVDDLLRALRQAPAGDERLQWARDILSRAGHRLDTPDDRARAGRYLVENFARVARESDDLSRALARADALSDEARARSARARVFATRGLAPDTSWPINSAIAAALASLRERGLPAGGSVRRAAIVGPGLDFTDKDEGHDHYPVQSLQPFALIDTLLAMGLARPEALDIVACDINPRVLDHLRRLHGSPHGRSYVVHVVRARDVPWSASASAWFASFGSHLGPSVAPASAPATAGPLEARAIRVAPEHLRRVVPVDLDIVHQRLDLAPGQRFDLVVATNVLLYYDAGGQALAAANIASMLAPGGLLLTNTHLEDAALAGLELVTSQRQVFSGRPGDGETVHAYALGEPSARPEP